MGFPSETFVGQPPNGKDFNGIFRRITRWLRWWNAGGQNKYDAAFAADIGGYPAGAVLQGIADPSRFYRSTADNNTTNPEGGANWEPAFSGESIKAGSIPVDKLEADFPAVETSGNKRCVKYPNGWARQSGTVSVGPDSAQSVTFLHGFTAVSVDYGCSPLMSTSDVAVGNSTFITAISTSGMTIRNGDNSLTATVSYYAEGFIP